MGPLEHIQKILFQISVWFNLFIRNEMWQEQPCITFANDPQKISFLVIDFLLNNFEKIHSFSLTMTNQCNDLSFTRCSKSVAEPIEIFFTNCFHFEENHQRKKLRPKQLMKYSGPTNVHHEWPEILLSWFFFSLCLFFNLFPPENCRKKNL